MMTTRRNFLYLLSASTVVTWLGSANPPVWAAPAIATTATTGEFKLPPLTYDYNALEPHIDAKTMKFHHDNHHATYVKNLNAAIAKYPQLKPKTVEELLTNLGTLPKDIQTTVRNNGGGHFNHTMFWQIMGPKAGGAPTGAIATAIKSQFGTFDTFKTQFNDAGTKLFGSGWVWLINDKSKLKIVTTSNQDSPIFQGLYPIMGNDVWEHAYYLTYQNRRPEYLSAWWNVINWTEVNRRFERSLTA
ncbi:superoxide dismutase [Chamaesiphon sp.]|uniref:superoxide dismutase n=1 Tax=Chamaesiphon sp. TaxID=2814140 RepID=UPI0035947EDF